ncbi:MAG: hypothetical protein JAZ03_18215, partial [Candidatus Thiodiazotropha taylori]|nr:hypothetical protein [Candidatus Thiodiazotropha taylori]MCW4335862.1 hypothetical protein [Candidatus Thiodiazotropha endolucinida]
DYTERESTTKCSKDKLLNVRDHQYKMRVKSNAENKFTKPHKLMIGDYVLLKQKKVNKWTTPYEPVRYIVLNIKGSSIWARRVTDGREVCRDSTCFKFVKRSKRHGKQAAQNGQATWDWRGSVLRKAKEGIRKAVVQNQKKQSKASWV